MEFFYFYAFIFKEGDWIIDVPQAAFTPRKRCGLSRAVPGYDSAYPIRDPFDIYHDPGKPVKLDSLQHHIIF